MKYSNFKMITVGSEAPDFKLASQFDTEYTLSQFKGSKKCYDVFLPRTGHTPEARKYLN